MLNISII